MPRRYRNKKQENIIHEGITIISFGLAIYIAPKTDILTTTIYILFTTLILILAFYITGILIYLAGRFTYRKIQKKYNNPQSKRWQDKLYPKHQPIKNKKEFLSQAEAKFKKILRKNLPENIEIHCKVRLSDILKTETHNPRTNMMHIDYALLNEETQKIILAIELDDKSHNTPEAQERDKIKNNALDNSNIPYVRVKNMYDQKQLDNIRTFCIKRASTESQ